MKKLNFGCGNIIKQRWDNVDIQKDRKLTKSFDFNNFPYPIKDSTYDYILVDNVLEHLEKPDKVIDELWRISKKRGFIDIIVPHYTNKGAYNDVQHQHFFNENAFLNLPCQNFRINKKIKLKLKKLEVTPTLIGKFIPAFIRKKLSLFINSLNSQIHCIYEVIK